MIIFKNKVKTNIRMVRNFRTGEYNISINILKFIEHTTLGFSLWNIFYYWVGSVRAIDMYHGVLGKFNKVI